ncbi:MAG: YkgJ family cysteine cluster protein [Fervidobacterium sp.]|nr:YkgJ family cysteine cluster protein [Fervidobacterium sp.]
MKKGVEINNICKVCGGKCCKTFPGPATPEDFGAPDLEKLRKNLLNSLISGRWTVDWINQENNLYFVRPAVKGFENVVFDHTYNGICTFLTESGCELSFENRPESCRMLVPKLYEKCDTQGYTRMYVAKLWKDYINILLDVAIQAENGEFSNFL